MKNAKTVPMSEIRAHYAHVNPGGHWFDRGTMQFFKTVLPRTGYLIGDAYLFVTSETQPGYHAGDNGKTRFSVRSMCRASGNVVTVGEFHSYLFKEDATAAIAKIAESAAQAYALKRMAVVYTIPGEPEQSFLCAAEDAEHAREQCENAYPECRVIRVARA